MQAKFTDRPDFRTVNVTPFAVHESVELQPECLTINGMGESQNG